MNIHLTADQEATIRRAIDSGRASSAADLVSEALDLWEARERLSAQFRTNRAAPPFSALMNSGDTMGKQLQ